MRGKKSAKDNRLPQRLFATDRFPTGRLNIYSKPDIIPFINHVLKGTKELQFIKNSCFGKLFELPARQCPVSCKLIHALLTRQLIVEDKHTLWTVFRDDPLRFGLPEFGTITGLPCGEFPEAYETDLEDQSKANKDPDWIRLIGKKNVVTIADLRDQLESDQRMPGWKKLQLALILIVDGVLIAHQQKTRPTLKYVKMVQNLEAFCQHPWGRESFLKTIDCMKPPQDCDNPTAQLVTLLRQDSFRLKGFPLALQLLAFQAIPKLLTLIPAPDDTLSISDLEEPHLPLHANISYADILRVEADDNLQVTSLIEVQRQTEPGWGVFQEVVADERVKYMENLLASDHTFKKHLWPGGSKAVPFRVHKPPVKDEAPKRNVLKPRKTIKRPPSSRKQRRISSYFSRTASSSNPNEQILELLTEVCTHVQKIRKENKVLRQLIKRRKSRSHSKRSAFHSVISASEKSRPSHRSSRTDPTELTTDAPAQKMESPTPMDEDQNICTSPVISQYAAQKYGLSVETSNAPNPSVHTSPVHKSSDQTTPIHNVSIEHTDTVHTTPVHNSPLIAQTVPLGAERKTPLPSSPSGTPPWLASPKSPDLIYKASIYDPAEHPDNHPFIHLLNQGLEIFEPISPEPASLDKPRYDTSTRREAQPPLHPITPDTSPNKSSGFADHAGNVNAFAATATSKRTPIPILNFDQSQEDPAEEDFTELSDGSPARPTPVHNYSEEESLLATELFKCTSVPALALLPPLPESLWDLFYNTLQSQQQVFHITPSKYDFSNKFVLEIAAPQQWTSTFHMEILMFMLAGRHRELLQREKLAFTAPFLTSGIQEVWKRLKPIKRKDLFHWDKNLTDFVLRPGGKWMEDVMTVYTPMIWDDRHWVGLAINLDMGYVEIMDPLPSLYSDKKVVGFMECILTSLPYLVKKVAKPQQTQFRGLKPFYWKRMKDIYVNERGGDCGPVSVKFMEFHAHGDPEPNMSGITDTAVDDMRKQYAMDVYKTLVLPAYHAPIMP